MDLLDPLDAALVEMEPRTQPQHVAAVLILLPPDGAGPDYVDDLYRAALASTAPIDPRLSRYPYRGTDTGGMWIWRDAENLDIKEHVKRATLPPGAGREAFWLLISELHAQGLDRSRPMWTFHLIDGLDDGHFAFYASVDAADLWSSARRVDPP
jgi:diacylglycerol O-acyltransferase